MRNISLKLSILALVITAALAMVPAASATSVVFTLTSNNIGATGSLGTITVTDVAGGVTVAIAMNPTGCSGGAGCDFKLNGGDIVFGLSSGSVTSVDLGTGVSAHFKTNNPGPFKLGGSVFNIQNITGAGSTATQNFTFTILGSITASSFTSFELHVCDASNLTSCTNNTGFAAGSPTGTPPPPPVPEPGTLGLLGTGLVGIAGLVRRRLKS